MEKLLTLITKLKNEIVPESPVGKMPKEALLAFIRDANLLDRMRTFHQKEIKGVRSVITDDEAPLVPSESDIQKWRVGKLRKLVRDFHRATQILKKFTKFSAGRLRSHIKRNRYEEMLYGDDLDMESDEEPEKKKKRKKPAERGNRPVHEKKEREIHMPSIVINTGDNPTKADKEKKKCGGCCEEKENKLADQDFFGLIQRLSPNLYKVLAEKAFLLDMCALDRKGWKRTCAQLIADPRRGTSLRAANGKMLPLRGLSSGTERGWREPL